MIKKNLPIDLILLESKDIHFDLVYAKQDLQEAAEDYDEALELYKEAVKNAKKVKKKLEIILIKEN